MRSPLRNWFSLLPLLLAVLGAPARAAQPPPAPALPDIRTIVSQRERAVVRVETFEGYFPGLLRRGGRLLNPFPLRSTLGDAASFVFFIPTIIVYPLRKHLGSGVLIDAEGHLLTNHHVVKGADQVVVRLTDAKGTRRKFDAKVVGTDPQVDIALVKIDPGTTPLVTAPLGDSEQLALGDWVVAIGHPMALTGSVTCGIVSGLHRQMRVNPLEDYIQIEAAVNPGNSGGPILNDRGQVVGIVSLGLFPANNIGFAVPTGLITPFLDDFKRHGRPRRGYLGIDLRDVTPELAKDEELDVEAGAYVARVAYSSPAGRAGIERGDVIVAVGGREVAKAREVQMAVLRTPPGRSLAFTVRRDGKLRDLAAEPVERRKPFRIF